MAMAALASSCARLNSRSKGRARARSQCASRFTCGVRLSLASTSRPIAFALRNSAGISSAHQFKPFVQ